MTSSDGPPPIETHIVRPSAGPSPPGAHPFLRRSLAGLALASIVAIAAPWIAIDRISSFGPWIANTARIGLGPGAVAWLEDRVYGVEDRWNRVVRHGERPRAYWRMPPSPPPPTASAPEAAAEDEVSFRPVDVGPMLPRVAAAGDGVWVPVDDPERPDEKPILYKTLIHPDAARPWAEVFVTAIDLRRVHVFAVAGSESPEALTAEGRGYARSAVIPRERQGTLVAAFNGGWRSEHGQYGMEVDGVVLVPPKDKACTIAAYDDGTIQIATWTSISSERARTWWRQTPACLYENGSRHPGLSREEAWAWGAAVNGETIIRRSALGLDERRGILFMGVSNATSAAAIAEGMHHAGASDVAELDVNWSFPKFVVFRHDAAGELVAEGLFAGFVVDKDEYVRGRARKDFFYVAREP
jgi:hypothetical protein